MFSVFSVLSLSYGSGSEKMKKKRRIFRRVSACLVSAGGPTKGIRTRVPYLPPMNIVVVVFGERAGLEGGARAALEAWCVDSTRYRL